MFELSISAKAEQVDAISDALQDGGAMAITLLDADADDTSGHALFGEPGMEPAPQHWPRSRLTALFPDLESAQAAARLLSPQAFFVDAAVESITPVTEQDWVRLTQSQFEPLAITPEFWVVPSWHAVPPAARHAIRLDPGLAFGTGSHATTRMCLRWLVRQSPHGQRVLDYGCGSGILAIAAALLGAARVDAVDIDPAALQASQANARANRVTLAIGTPELAVGAYDILLANILATPLKVLAPLLCGHVAAGGRLALAGILDRQAAELQQCYQPWLQLEVVDRLDGWILLAAARA